MITSHFVTGMFTIGSYIVDLSSQVLPTSIEVSANKDARNVADVFSFATFFVR